MVCEYMCGSGQYTKASNRSRNRPRGERRKAKPFPGYAETIEAQAISFYIPTSLVISCSLAASTRKVSYTALSSIASPRFLSLATIFIFDYSIAHDAREAIQTATIDNIRIFRTETACTFHNALKT